jgi:hypothetical protein
MRSSHDHLIDFPNRNTPSRSFGGCIIIGGVSLSNWKWITYHRCQPSILTHFNKIEQAERKWERKQEEYAVYQILKARGKRRQNPFQVIPRFNHPRISSGSFFNPASKVGIPDIKPKGSIMVMPSNTHNDVGQMGDTHHSNNQHVSNLVADGNEAAKRTLSTSKAENNMFDRKYIKENCPQTVTISGGQLDTTLRPTLMEFLLNCVCLDEPQRKCFDCGNKGHELLEQKLTPLSHLKVIANGQLQFFSNCQRLSFE